MAAGACSELELASSWGVGLPGRSDHEGLRVIVSKQWAACRRGCGLVLGPDRRGRLVWPSSCKSAAPRPATCTVEASSYFELVGALVGAGSGCAAQVNGAGQWRPGRAAAAPPRPQPTHASSPSPARQAAARGIREHNHALWHQAHAAYGRRAGAHARSRVQQLQRKGGGGRLGTLEDAQGPGSKGGWWRARARLATGRRQRRPARRQRQSRRWWWWVRAWRACWQPLSCTRPVSAAAGGGVGGGAAAAAVGDHAALCHCALLAGSVPLLPPLAARLWCGTATPCPPAARRRSGAAGGGFGRRGRPCAHRRGKKVALALVVRRGAGPPRASLGPARHSLCALRPHY